MVIADGLPVVVVEGHETVPEAVLIVMPEGSVTKIAGQPPIRALLEMPPITTVYRPRHDLTYCADECEPEHHPEPASPGTDRTVGSDGRVAPGLRHSQCSRQAPPPAGLPLGHKAALRPRPTKIGVRQAIDLPIDTHHNLCCPYCAWFAMKMPNLALSRLLPHAARTADLRQVLVVESRTISRCDRWQGASPATGSETFSVSNRRGIATVQSSSGRFPANLICPDIDQSQRHSVARAQFKKMPLAALLLFLTQPESSASYRARTVSKRF